MAKTSKTLRKRDILIYVVILVAAALLVFGASEVIEHVSKNTSRESRPIDPNAAMTTSDETATPAPETTLSASGLTTPSDEGQPENAKTEDEIQEEINQLKNNFAANSYNNNIKNIVFIGVDKRELGEQDLFRTAGQSDTIMILSMNLKTKEYWIVGINRDLAVPVENYSLIGSSYGYITEQIALAYAYGDGTRISGRNVLKSLNYLLCGSIPFLGYIASPISIIGALADAVDGVPVEIVDDFSDVDDTLIKGTTAILKGEHAEKYIRARKWMKDDPYNSARMTRQFAFCQSFMDKAKSTMSAKQLVDLYEDIMGMMMTDIGKSDITKWILTVYDYDFKGFYRIDGVRHEDDLKHDAPYNDIDFSEVEDLLNELYFKK